MPLFRSQDAGPGAPKGLCALSFARSVRLLSTVSDVWYPTRFFAFPGAGLGEKSFEAVSKKLKKLHSLNPNLSDLEEIYASFRSGKRRRSNTRYVVHAHNFALKERFATLNCDY
jgi:hypothetical protein